MYNLHTILVPIDLSSIDHGAYELSCSLAQRYGAQLIVLFVDQEGISFCRTSDLVWGDDRLRPLEPPKGQGSLCAELRRALPPDANVRTEYLVRVGTPSENILACAQQEQVDLIVIGAHSKGMFSQILVGSVSREVIKRARCSVFVLRPFSRMNQAEPVAADTARESLPKIAKQ